ncbi:MAG: glutamate--tRNA ligase [Fibrobacteres bacterium]|nr:glutamate--tRNA ligase [Fibrobacterota bacterium]
MSDKKIRVRIATSPTGEPHVGTAYIALFNYCFAKANGGEFILRIEDTDQTRSTRESEESIYKALSWLGFKWSEGPDVGGPCAPYRQSERTDIYKKHSDILLNNGSAYRCFCSSERLDEMRKKLIAEKKNFFYDGLCRNLSREESDRRAAAGESYVVRMAIPRDEGAVTSFHDEIRQKAIELAHTEIDDQILMKADGFPTYHLANVVDDHLMSISHVIRAEEWITSTPKHVLLYKAFGWEAPKFAHVSLLRNADKSKVSKRKNPVSLNWFRAAGYTKEAITNFLGLMGYNSGSENERFTIEDISRDFTIDRISTSAPIFDLQKLNVLNEEYIRKYSVDKYIEYLSETTAYAAQYLRPILGEIQSRHKISQDFQFWARIFFTPGIAYSKEAFAIKEMDKPSLEKALKGAADALDESKAVKPDEFEKAIAGHRDSSGIKMGSYMMALRVALTGSSTSLPLNDVMAMLGRDRTIMRLKEANAFVRNNIK